MISIQEGDTILIPAGQPSYWCRHEKGYSSLVIHISPTYFARLFKQAIGTSPHQYVIQQRVEQAKSMLLKTDLAIADNALQVGFSSQSHLTKQFKRITGMTPKQIR